MSAVVITLTNGKSDYDLVFDLLDIDLAQRWLEHLDLFVRAGQPWDDPKRFYNFPKSEYTHDRVVEQLRYLTEIIKSHAPHIIDRHIGTSLCQDDLNYLHHVFEVYHGGYDQQDHNDFFRSAPAQVQQALADLNIWIHRYETLGGIPRFVGTWRCKPRRDCFTQEDFKLFSLHEEWGDLRINYCEIGKTLYDLWHDHDQYIDPTGFQPHHHYCFDFTVRFSHYAASHWQNIEHKVWKYYDAHSDFFRSRGYQRHDPRLALGGITIAKLRSDSEKSDVIAHIADHQIMKSIRQI